MKEVNKISEVFLYENCCFIEITENSSLIIDKIGSSLLITQRKQGNLFIHNINLT